jgi:hypothetical protein
MNLCDACETAAWCSKNGCIPVTQPEPAKASRLKGFIRLLMLGIFRPMHQDLWDAKRPLVYTEPPPLKFPEIDEALLPNLLPTKETTA